MASINYATGTSTKRSGEMTAGERPKRRKTAVACNECRDRKRKCDGRRPVCGACSIKSKGEQNCTWDSDKTGKFHNSQYVISLETRVRQLESMLERRSPSVLAMQTDTHQMSFDTPTQEQPATSPAASDLSLAIVPAFSPSSGRADVLQTRPHISEHTRGRLSIPTQPPTHDPSIPELTHETKNVESTVGDGARVTIHLNCPPATALEQDLDETEESDADVDGMGAVASNSLHEPSTTGTYAPERAYFGPSSTLGFMKHIQAVLQPANAADMVKPARNERSGYSQALKKAITPTFSRRHYVIPPKSLANALLSSYWNYVHPIYPYLFKTALNIRYQKLWSDPDEKSDPKSLLDSSYAPEGHLDGEDYYGNEPIFFCIINLVFALGAQYSPVVDPGERSETGEIFFQRAKEFVNLDSLEYGEVTLVQAFLLMGLYLQSTDRSSMCWNIVGLAIRTSQSIGLDKPVHRYRPGSRRSRLDEEIRKRLWGGCILQDRYTVPLQTTSQITPVEDQCSIPQLVFPVDDLVLTDGRVASMMFGRPLMLHPASVGDISLPTAIEEEELMTATLTPDLHPSTKPNYITFFAHGVKLCQLVGEVLDAIYGGGAYPTVDTEPGSTTVNTKTGSASSLIDKIKTGNIHDILKLDAELTKWREDLPWFLQISTYTNSSTAAPAHIQDDNPILTEISHELLPILLRQAKILQARFLHVKILLSRPVLAVLLSNTEAPVNAYSAADALQKVLQQTTLEKISKHCIQAAQDLINLVYDSLISGDITLPAWWYNVFYLYTVATIFVAQRLCPPLMPSEAEEQWQQCWDKCLRGLHRYKSQSVVARRCYKVLELVNKQLFRAKDRVHTLPTSLPNPATSGGQQGQRNQAINPVAETDYYTDNSLRTPGGGEVSFNLALDAQDMEWLVNIPFDPTIDTDPSIPGWGDERGIDQDLFFPT